VNIEDHVEKVIIFLTQLKDLYDPVLHIVFVVRDIGERIFPHNKHNKYILKALHYIFWQE
jgi:hypothetical protein